MPRPTEKPKIFKITEDNLDETLGSNAISRKPALVILIGQNKQKKRKWGKHFYSFTQNRNLRRNIMQHLKNYTTDLMKIHRFPFQLTEKLR